MISGIQQSRVVALAVGLTLCPTLSALAVENTAPTQFEEAASVRANGDLGAAVLILKSLLQNSPENLQARLMLGEIYLQQGTPLAAQKELEFARSLGADDQRINVGLAEALLMQAKFDEALEELGGATLRAGDTLDQVLVKAQALLGLNRMDESRTAYRRALQIAPQSERAHTGLGRALIQNRDWAGAAEQFDAVLATNPVAIDAWVAKGELAQAQDDLPGAINAYKTALDLSPESVQIHLFKAAAHLDIGQLDSALKDVDFVLEQVEFEPQALYLKSQVLARQGQADEARKLMHKAVDLLNNADQDMLASFPSLLRLAGVCNAAVDQNLRAIDYFDKYLVRYPNDAASLRWRAALALRQDQPSDAVPLLKRLLSKHEDDVAALNLMGMAQIRMNQFDQALPYFQHAAFLAPSDSMLSRGLGGSYLSLGDTKGAIAALSDAVTRNPDDLSSVIMLVLAHLQEKDTDSARAALRTYGSHWSNTPILKQLAAATDVADGNFDGARKQLKAALREDGAYEPARLALARVELQSSNLKDAEALYRETLSKDERNMAAIEGLAQTALAKQDFANAVTWFRRAHDLAPANGDITQALITSLVKSNNTNDAEILATDFLRSQPGNIPVLAAYADILNSSDRARESIKLYRTAISSATSAPQYYIGLAKAQLLAGDTTAAMETYQRATKIFPVSIDLYRNYVSTALRQGETQQARDAAEQLYARLPESNAAMKLRGDVMMASRNFQKAYDFYSAIPEARLSGTIVAGKFNAAMTLGNAEEELPRLMSWVHDHPADTTTKALLAGAYQALGKTDAAIRQYEELRPRMPHHAGLLNNLAWLYYITGDSRALETAEQAYAVAPDNANTADTYGWIMAESGDPEKALPLLRKARSLDASSAIIQFHTGAALNDLGRTGEARRELESAISSGRSFDGIERARDLLKTIQTSE